MADEVTAGAAVTPSGTDAGSGTSGAGSGTADTAALSDQQFLETQAPGQTQGDTTTAITKETPPAEAPSEDAIVKLDALEEGEPQWFASLKDAEQAKQAREQWQALQTYQKHFKTPAEVEDFFKELPGGREQVAALQTLNTQVLEEDALVEGSDFNGHLDVAGRFLSRAGNNALSLTRAWAQQVAKTQPEVWQQASKELVESTLKSAGVGADLATLLSGIKEMRAAITANDGEAFGRAAAKLLGEPVQEPREDSNVVKFRTDAQQAQQELNKVLGERWESSVQTNVGEVEQMLRTEAGKKIATVLTESIYKGLSEQKRGDLVSKIVAEVDSQIGANSWLRSQIAGLVGNHQQKNLKAGKEEWSKALELSKTECAKLIAPAVRKVITAWSKEFASENAAARAKASGAAKKPDVGGSSARVGQRGQLTEDMVRDRNVTDEELLGKFSR